MQADKAANGGTPARAVGARAGWTAAASWLAWALVLLLPGCAEAPAEQRLRERIAAMEAAVEQRDAAVFMEGVAGNFIGDHGLDQQGLRRLLTAQMLRNAEISAVLGPLDLELTGDRARVRFELVVTGGAGGFLPERGRAVEVDSAWRDGPDGWQVVTAEWTDRF